MAQTRRPRKTKRERDAEKIAERERERAEPLERWLNSSPSK